MHAEMQQHQPPAARDNPCTSPGRQSLCSGGPPRARGAPWRVPPAVPSWVAGLFMLRAGWGVTAAAWGAGAPMLRAQLGVGVHELGVHDGVVPECSTLPCCSAVRTHVFGPGALMRAHDCKCWQCRAHVSCDRLLSLSQRVGSTGVGRKRCAGARTGKAGDCIFSLVPGRF